MAPEWVGVGRGGAVRELNCFALQSEAFDFQVWTGLGGQRGRGV